MIDWIKQNITLTREERLLVAGILLIALCGLGVEYFQKVKQPVKNGPIATVETAD